LNDIISEYPGLSVHYHNEFSSKTCPGKLFDKSKVLSVKDLVMAFYKEIYQKENPNGGKVIKDPEGAIKRIVDGK
jgi:hypothetical protein